MLRKSLMIAASIHLVSCIPQGSNQSSIFSAEDDLPLEYANIVVAHRVITENDFEDYEVGEVDSSSGFPTAYVALPVHESFKGEYLNIELYLLSDNDDKYGYVAQFDGKKWINYNGNEIRRMTLRLLGKKNPRLTIEIRGPGFSYVSNTVKLGPGKVINPFLGLQFTKYDASSLPWVKDMKDRTNKLLNLSVFINEEGEKAPLRRFAIRQERVNGEFITPSAGTLFITNKSLDKLSVRLLAQFGDDEGRLVSGSKVYKTYDDFLKATAAK